MGLALMRAVGTLIVTAPFIGPFALLAAAAAFVLTLEAEADRRLGPDDEPSPGPTPPPKTTAPKQEQTSGPPRHAPAATVANPPRWFGPPWGVISEDERRERYRSAARIFDPGHRLRTEFEQECARRGLRPPPSVASTSLDRASREDRKVVLGMPDEVHSEYLRAFETVGNRETGREWLRQWHDGGHM